MQPLTAAQLAAYEQINNTKWEMSEGNVVSYLKLWDTFRTENNKDLGVTASNIARDFKVSTANMTKMLKDLAKKGIVQTNGSKQASSTLWCVK